MNMIIAKRMYVDMAQEVTELADGLNWRSIEAKFGQSFIKVTLDHFTSHLIIVFGQLGFLDI